MKHIRNPLSIFKKIAETTSLSIRNIEFPNAKLNVGMFNENMGSVPQLDMLKAVDKPIPEINTMVDSSYNNLIGEGFIKIPEVKSYYKGEPYGY